MRYLCLCVHVKFKKSKMTEKNLIYYLVGVEVAYVSTRGPSTTTPQARNRYPSR